MSRLLNKLLIKLLDVHGKSHNKKDEQILDDQAEVMGIGSSRNPHTGKKSVEKYVDDWMATQHMSVSTAPVETSGVEINGPANIVMKLDMMMELGAITVQDYIALKVEAEKTISYMKRLDNPNRVRWSDVVY